MPAVNSSGTGAWVEREIEVNYGREGNWTKKRLKAICLGGIAIYSSEEVTADKKGLWSVTHRPTGRLILRVQTKTAALRIGETLREHSRRATEEPDPLKAKKLFPAVIIAWVKKCTEAMDYVEFKEPLK